MKFFKYFKFLITLFFLLAIVYATWHYFENKQPFCFPSPTGPHPVGTSIIHLIDHNRLETHVKNKEHPYRELMGQMWYPADPKIQKKLSIYDTRSLKADLHQEGIPMFLLAGLNNIFTHATLQASPVEQTTKFPVAIVDHGIGGSGLTTLTTLCEALASHGYFVIGVNHTYAVKQVTFPDGRIVHNRNMPALDKLKRPERLRLLTIEQQIWVEDIQFILNKLENMNLYDEKFKDKLDLQNIGIVGHSFGGSVATQLCRTEQRIKAGINMDGALRGEILTEGFDKPFMFLMATKEQRAAEENRDLFNNLLNDSYYVSVEGTHHGSFCDQVLLSKRSLFFGLLDKMINGLGLLDGYKAHEITQALVIDFFDKYLQDKPSMILDIPKNIYKEVTIERK